MPLQATSGAASYDAFGGGVAAVPNYIEDVFSTYLVNSTTLGASVTVNNGVDVSGKGALVWMKARNGGGSNILVDTARGASNCLVSDSTGAQFNESTIIPSFTSTGFTTGSWINSGGDATAYASWTFRKQPKFFDVVTYTGNSTYGRTVAHNLGSVPGFIIVKCTSAVQPWAIYHRSLGGTKYMNLNSTSASTTDNAYWDNTNPTSTQFTVGGDGDVNGTGKTYVAYLFAHDAGGFGLTGTDNVISCGSYTGNGSTNGPTITLGYEPQWLMIKRTNSTGNWFMEDTMRGMNLTGAAYLSANLSTEEQVFTSSPTIAPNATGFQVVTSGTGYNASGSTYIYIAIRRGPMKVPTSGTSVFSPISVSNSTGTANTTNFPIDLQFASNSDSVHETQVMDRLRGVITTNTDAASPYSATQSTGAEKTTFLGYSRNWGNTGFATGSSYSGLQMAYWNFRRAPSFFDVVCYTGNGVTRDINHNLGVTPEFYIVKQRSGGTGLTGWVTGGTIYPNSTDYYTPLLNTNSASTSTANAWNTPTSTTFGIGTAFPNTNEWNKNGALYVAYLFATCAGVSKVTSFTGNGSSQTINCGFTAGSRFVMIKRTDSTGDWYVWDSARGIVSGNDPHLSLNSTAAEVTTDDTIDTDSTGFIVNQVSATNSNVNGASYIVLAIA
jgi:hypothetical protein